MSRCLPDERLIHHTCRHFYAFPDISEQITLSIGMASIPDSSIDSTATLVHEADLALYETQTKGGNTVELA